MVSLTSLRPYLLTLAEVLQQAGAPPDTLRLAGAGLGLDPVTEEILKNREQAGVGGNGVDAAVLSRRERSEELIALILLRRHEA